MGLQIVLAVFTTPSNINDTTMLPVMLAENRHRGFDFVGGFFDGDKGYDSDYNCELLFWMGMIPNIRQRKDAVNRGKSHRRKTAGMFSDSEHRKRALRGHLRGRGDPAAPAALPVRPGGQPAPVRQR